MSVQFKGLSDGTDCDLDGASVHSIALATGASMDIFGKGGDEFDSVIGGDVGEHGVHVMEGFDELFPMVPVMLPFHVRCRHNASIDTLPFSSEKTCEAILLLRRKPHHKQFCSGKEELKVSKKSLSEMTNVWLVAMLQWKVHDAMSAIVLLTPAMDREVSGDALLTWMCMVSACMRRPAIGECDVLSLLVQLTVGVLSHHAATCTCCRGTRCSRLM